MDAITVSIASAVEEQTATTREIGRNLAEAARASGEIADSMSRVASLAGSTTTAAAQSLDSTLRLSGLSSELSQMLGRFQLRS